MANLAHYFKAYTGVLRRFKGSYVVNNLLNRKKLAHNRALYKKYGVDKSIFAPIGRKDLRELDTVDVPWLDRPDATAALRHHPKFASFPQDWQKELERFIEDGYMILRGFYDPAAVERLNTEVDRLLTSNTTGFNYTGRKVMDAYQQSALIDTEYFRNERLLELLSFALGKSVIPFQTINFLRGSEQRAHSDSIHMTTAPLGYLIASWTALEKVDESNGTLFYYPKSHRLPYVSCEDFNAGNSTFLIAADSNKAYEDYMEQQLQEAGLTRQPLIAEPGDVLIWHGNLVHGGGAIQREGATRRSMVAHYYAQDAICYHELTQRPALI